MTVDYYLKYEAKNFLKQSLVKLNLTQETMTKQRLQNMSY